MPEKKPSIVTSHHLKSLKQQQWNRKLVETVMDLVKCNDHNSLAFIARTSGIPPQLRHVVWPILLKYHPMCISPNIISNVFTWDPNVDVYHFIENNRGNNSNTLEDVEGLILHDLSKYFHLRNSNNSNMNSYTTSSSEVSTVSSIDINLLSVDDELEILEALKKAILKFLAKWSRIFKYESGLAWIATGLAEWVPVLNGSTEDENGFNFDDNDDYDDEGPVVLNGKKHSHSHPHYSGAGSNFNASPPLNNTCISYLYKEYPLPGYLRSSLPKAQFTFDEIYERLLLVILHCPDTVLAQKQLESELQSTLNINRSDKSKNANYFPVISGGDLSYQTQIFFKVFSTILPELYQPFTEESVLQPSSKRTSWLYWWIKCSGARALQRQDRARLWDVLLGWRPKPNMDSIDFFLNYNTKKFDHFYNEKSQIPLPIIKHIAKNDPFWFPDLNSIKMGSKKFKFDYNVLKELLNQNRIGHKTINSEPEGNDDGKLSFSLIDPHMQLVFIYIAILQYNEFKLLEFEETETSEFLNHVPMLSKADDACYKKLYELGNIMDPNGSSSQEDLHKRPGSTNMLIEVGNDAKASHSFNDLLNMAGDIWRKWLWNELEDSSVNE